MDRGLFVSYQHEAWTHLKDRGYVDCLSGFGWKVDWKNPRSADIIDPAGYGLIMWDGAIPRDVLERVRPGQILIAMGGAGDNIEHYTESREKISIATTLLFYFDDPPNILTSHNLSKYCLLPQRALRLWLYQKRFRRYGAPEFWRRLGVPFLYLPYASDPKLFHPLPSARRDLRWMFRGTLHNRTFVPRLMRYSASRGVSHFVASPDIGTAAKPEELNELYSRATLSPNEHWQGVFGRELNQRVFDLGMAGVFQVSDMQWLARSMVGPYAAFYAGKLADRAQMDYGCRLVKQTYEVTVGRGDPRMVSCAAFV